MSKGLEALERLMANYYEMCQDLGNNDDQYQRCNLTSERAIIEKELKALEILTKHIDGCVKFRVLKEPSDCFLVIEEWFLDLKTYEIKVAITQEEYDLLKEVLK